MGYLAVWKVLEEIIAEFRKRGLTIPAEVLNNLKSAKTMIKILNADPNRGDTIQKIEEYLGMVESYLLSEGQAKFEADYVEKWMKKLDEAYRQPFDEEVEKRFVSGLPREEKWIRIMPSKELSLEKLKAVAKEANLKCEVQEDGYLLVYGEDECIKDFVKRMATKYGLKAGKER